VTKLARWRGSSYARAVPGDEIEIDTVDTVDADDWNDTDDSNETKRSKFLRPKSAFMAVLVLVVCSHLLLSVLGTVASSALDPIRPAGNLAIHQQLEVARHELSPHRVVHLWYNWDALHYERLSDHWFDVRAPLAPNVVTAGGGRAWDEFSWPPLYPVVVGLFHRLTFVKAGAVMVLLGIGLQVTFLWLLRRLSLANGDDDDTAMAVVLVAIAMPFAFFLGTPLSEPLFVTLAVSSLLALRQQRWLLAGLAAAAMPWTKIAGVLMVVPLAISGIGEVRRSSDRSWRTVSRAFAPALMCGLSFVLYLGFARWLTGTPWAPFETQRVGWGNSTGNPILNLIRDIDRWQYVAVAGLLVLTAALGVRRWISWTEASFCLVMLLAASSVATIVPAAPRYAAVAFPLATGLARWARARSVLPYLVGTGAIVQGAVFIVWSTYWIGEMY